MRYKLTFPVLALLLLPGLAFAEDHSFSASASNCAPSGFLGNLTTVEYWAEGTVLNRSTTNSQAWTCPVDNLYEGSGTADWQLTPFALTAGVQVQDWSESEHLRCQSFSRTISGGWSWTVFENAFATPEETGVRTMGVPSPLIRETDNVSIMCVVPPVTHTFASSLVGYYAIYKD
jgi:hypothetical protein